MPRITHVKKAQQRYETVPVLNDDGTPKVTPVMRNGEQRVTKRGKAVTMRVTIADKTKPLPPLRCDFAGCDIDDGKILPGSPYKHITPKSGPYGGTQRSRHEAHPNWNVWEYSSSVSAQAAQLQAEMHDTIDSYELTVVGDFEDMKNAVGEMADEFVSDREEAVSNMPEGLQDGSQAQEYHELAESWKDGIDEVDAPDLSEYVEAKWFVNGPDAQSLNEDGYDTEEDAREALLDHLEANEDDDEDDWTVEEGDGPGEDDEVTDEWIDAAKDALREAVDGCEI